MNILLMIFFFGLAMSLIVLKGIFMSQEFAACTKRRQVAKSQADTTEGSEDCSNGDQEDCR